MESSTRSWGRLQLAFALLCVLLCASCVGMRTIEGSNSWRAPQPSAGELRVAAEQGVNTVLCLRKARPGRPWYEEELAVCRDLGLNFRTLDWSALDSDPAQIARLIQALQELPPPYLIHCKHGVDRSGLAAAVFRVVALGHKKRDAGSELSILNGHLAFLPTGAMDEAWRNFRWPPPQPPAEAGDRVAVGP